MHINRVVTASHVLAIFFLLFLATAPVAHANPPNRPGGGGPYRSPGDVINPTAPAPLTPAQQLRVDRIVSREIQNAYRAEQRLLEGINRIRAGRGERPIRVNLRDCYAEGPESDYLSSAIARFSRVNAAIRVAAERFVRQNPRAGVLDRVVRFFRGDDDDGPPSTGSGGNLGADFILDDVDLHGSEDDRAGSAGMRGAARDGIVGEDLADPDALPSGPHLLVIPPASGIPGVPLPSIQLPEPLIFRLPEPLFIRNEDRRRANERFANNCTCSAGNARISSRREDPLAQLATASTGTEIGAAPPSLPSADENPSGGADLPALMEEIGEIGWNRFRLLRSGGQFENCYTISASGTRGGQIKRLRGAARIFSTNRGRSWNIAYGVTMTLKKENRDTALAIEVAMEYEGRFDGDTENGNGAPVDEISRQVSGSVTVVNPSLTPSTVTIPVGNSDIPSLPGAETRIETANSQFKVAATAPRVGTVIATLPKHRN